MSMVKEGNILWEPSLSDLSPRHVPDEIYQVSGIPKTLNGKKWKFP